MKAVRFVSLAALGLALAACRFGDKAETVEAGAVVERDVAIGAFQKVAVSGPYEVEVKAGGQPGIHVSGGENLIAASEFVVEGDTLKIRTKERNIRWHTSDDSEKVRVTVSGGGAISAAAIAGSGGLKVERATAPNFEGAVAGSGDLEIAALETGEAKLSIAGSGDISAAGKAQRVRAEIAGSGDIDAAGLNATDADVSIAGSGNIRAHATGAANVSITGSGNIAITGGAKCNVSKRGSGEVTCS